MSESELIPDRIILGEVNYASALDLIIAKAEKELLIFDQDFVRGDYTSQQRFEMLYDFLSHEPLSKLTIILHDAQHLVNHCPKLFELLKTFGHKFTVYETNDAAKIAKDCFVLADKRHYLRRFHIDQARFKFALEDEETSASLLARFNELLDETISTVSITKLGL